MSSHSITMDPAPELLRVETDPYADMHAPDRPYRLILTAPDLNVSEEGDAAVNLSESELRGLRDACTSLLLNARSGGSRAL